MKTKQMRFWILLGVLLFGGAVMNVWLQTGEAHVERQELKQFPATVGEWKQYGVDTRFDKETERVLRADDYLARDYVTADGRVANFYVGYYASQRTGATYHSPLNCLPGSGWAMTDPSRLTVTPVGGGAPFEANRYIIQKGNSKQLLVYWYQGRGRSVASEYWGKLYTVIDSLRRRRSDGAMVRVMVPVVGSEEAALETAKNLAAQAAPQLAAYVPD
ncbi:MAG: EpsI family protein [Pyrinomonadaceae bacterium]|jgi:EpsI family protein|nr:EpsI family protein [Pyrinomonadaceae bacterium]